MASSSSFSPATQPRKYHVFLSFRGEDTRKTFVDHLYSALQQQGIHTYKDDKALPRGESIGPSLLKAIQASQIAVIIFSENYADSSWCLDELACIMKCRDTKGQIVMPVFYGVDPSEVRKQKRKYREAFDKYELENNRKVEGWRKALVDASNLSGWEPKHVANGHESIVIKEIVDTISQRLQLVTPSEDENLIGMAARMQHLRSELQVGSGGVRMVGIWGVGGGGKTTLASSIFDEISGNFDGSCFLNNIREESSKFGLIKLQVKILFGVLKQSQVQEIGRVEEGRRMIKDRLCHRMVLIVLDDVDHLDQLKALVGMHNWFGGGSRIIITTRDVHLLNSHRVDVMHNIHLLNHDEAIKLFRKLSPQDYRPKEDYERLSKEVVSYAGGLPLALTVLGSFLCDKDIDEWISALARLKEIPNDDILGKLKVSYDGLTKLEQELFLDIACFYRRMGKDEAMKKLDACGFHPVIGVKVLIQKALITISEGGEYFDMHDLVQEMGHHIARGEHPNNPKKYSRIWGKEDVLKICAMDATAELDQIEAIEIGYDWLPKKEEGLPLIAANMKNLRYIQLISTHANPLLNNFPPRELCCLKLLYGLQKQLWEGYKLLPNLKMMELSYLNYLIMTPDFDGLPNLKILTLDGCGSLEEIDPSIGRLERLVSLSIISCDCLEMFPPISGLKRLETLTFRGSPIFPKIQQQKMETSPHHNLDNSGNEVESIINFNVICWRCGTTNLPGVVCCGEEPCLCRNLRLGLFHNLQNLSLSKLDLRFCSLGDEDIGFEVLELPNLQELNLSNNSLSRLSFSGLLLPRLKLLNVSSNEGLVELSELPSSIAVVIADYCPSLESFGDISMCKWLWKVSLRSNRVEPLDGEMLLNSMLQGNAIKDHFISISLPHQIPKGFVGQFFKGKTFTKRLPHIQYDDDTFTLRLPDDWCNDFCGFLIRVVTKSYYSSIKIIMKQEPGVEDSQFEIWQESNDAPEPKYDGNVGTRVAYVSFRSLRQTTSLNQSYNIISFSIDDANWTSFAAELVPLKSKDDPFQKTKFSKNSSEFGDDGHIHRRAFTIQHDSKSSIKILWRS